VDNNRDGLIAVVSCPPELNRSAAVVESARVKMYTTVAVSLLAEASGSKIRLRARAGCWIAFSAVHLPVPYIQENRPGGIDLLRSAASRLRIRLSVLPDSVSKNQFNKGSSGLLCGIGQGTPGRLKSEASETDPSTSLRDYRFLGRCNTVGNALGRVPG
jgi:hypothetical protein